MHYLWQFSRTILLVIIEFFTAACHMIKNCLGVVVNYQSQEAYILDSKWNWSEIKLLLVLQFQTIHHQSVKGKTVKRCILILLLREPPMSVLFAFPDEANFDHFANWRSKY